MRIYHLKLQNFRGIKYGNFILAKPVVCLIGAGDSTKSTILDAIEFVLSPNWFIPFDDSDFTNCDVTEEIVIEVTIGPVPNEMIPDNKFGLHLRGWCDAEPCIHDEPTDEDLKVLTIRLTIDQYLTPEWLVITERSPDGIRISNKDRQRFQVMRIGTNIDNELSWTRGSSLLRLAADKQNAEQILLDANRKLRNHEELDKIEDIKASIESTKKGAKSLGIDLPLLKADIDPKSLRANTTVLSLHNNSVPARRLGLGSRRLVAIGAQLQCVSDGSVVLIDEIEYALEPHRIKHLIRKLVEHGQNGKGQVVMTSHSPATLEELGASPLYIVSSDTNKLETVLSDVQEAAQGTIRAIPEAFLSPRIIVCEGPTEIGVLRSFEKKILLPLGQSYGLAQVTIVNGGGSSAPRRAKDLQEHGYDVCMFVDSDNIDEWESIEIELIALGIKVVRWDDQACTEKRLIEDIPDGSGLLGLVKMALLVTGKSEESVLAAINSRLESEPQLGELSDIESYVNQNILKSAICVTSLAEKNPWFKNVFSGEILGDYVFDSLYKKMQDTDFSRKMDQIKEWTIGG